MREGEQQIWFYCPKHKVGFEALTAGKIVCAADPHTPSHPRLNLIIGISYLRKNRQAEKGYMMTLDKKKRQKEQWVDYHFHPPEAALQSNDPRKASLPQLVTCYGCAQTARFFYLFVEQLSR